MAIVLRQGIKRIERGVDKQKTYADLPVEHTTRLPLPLGAATCTHAWETTTKETIETEYERTHILVITCTKCGVVDKTIESCRASCQHDWHQTATVITPSAWEISKKYSNSYRNANDGEPWEFHQKSILVDICKNCGERHEIIVENFDLELAEKSENDRVEAKRLEAEARRKERELKSQEAADLKKAKEISLLAEQARVEANQQELILLKAKAKLKGIKIEDEEVPPRRRRQS